MKKTICGLLCLLLAVSLFGCSNQGKDSPSSKASAPPQSSTSSKAEQPESSKTTSSKAESSPAAPVPITIKNIKVDFNSIGVPELYADFTNTGDKDLVAFDFYVVCYDAYGETVKGFGNQEIFVGTYDAGLKPGKTSPMGFKWTMNGFSNTKTVKVAIAKYKVDREESVDVDIEQDSWVSMD